jgi:ornithine cyclodeaminase/alanine dehydrogenase-like protein (mu-crystallin family)
MISLAQNGVGHLRVVDIEPSKAERLAKRFAAEYPGSVAQSGMADLSTVDLLINATPVGVRTLTACRSRWTGYLPYLRHQHCDKASVDAVAGRRRYRMHISRRVPMVTAQAEAVLPFLG